MPAKDTRLPDGSREFVLQPNGSLAPEQARLFLWLTAGGCFAIALAFALQGMWPVLPFAGLEIGVLVWALRASMRQSRHRETIQVCQDVIRIERHDRAGIHHAEFARHWARVSVRPGAQRRHPSRLLIESQGRHCELGRFLTEEERQDIARRLRRVVGGMNASPMLHD
ncbi:MAG TPA: DUF2244 domain-containing protein [Steroidobacteraceae bacterium]|nr:DUF2244 domain-containing protein [Steroidobacteraceae bacterium]